MILFKKRQRYKYTLCADYRHSTGLLPAAPAEIGDVVRLGADGTLTIREGYAWDGPSGPTIDTPDFMRGSLVHDALYQLMREGLFPRERRDEADRLLREICLEDGMAPLRAWLVYQGVRLFGGGSAEADLRRAP